MPALNVTIGLLACRPIAERVSVIAALTAPALTLDEARLRRFLPAGDYALEGRSRRPTA